MFVRIGKAIGGWKLFNKGYDLVTNWRKNVGEQTVNGVKVKSPLLSKINWANALGILASVLAFFGVMVPPELKEQVGLAIAAVTSVVTIILRTWFNRTVTPE